MKVGDLVTWKTSTVPEENMGIITDGPRTGCAGEEKTISYQIAWFQAKEIYWHNDDQLRLYSETPQKSLSNKSLTFPLR